MYSDVNPAQPFETVPVHRASVVCDGNGKTFGHPRVYLHIDPGMGKIACPYCSREFVLAPGAHAAGH